MLGKAHLIIYLVYFLYFFLNLNLFRHKNTILIFYLVQNLKLPHLIIILYFLIRFKMKYTLD